jgi:hypothetical protein
MKREPQKALLLARLRHPAVVDVSGPEPKSPFPRRLRGPTPHASVFRRHGVLAGARNPLNVGDDVAEVGRSDGARREEIHVPRWSERPRRRHDERASVGTSKPDRGGCRGERDGDTHADDEDEKHAQT